MKSISKRLLIPVAILAIILVFVCVYMATGIKDVVEIDGGHLPLIFCLPFAGMLLSVAIIPLINGEFWEKYRPAFVAGWSLLFLVPFAIAYGVPSAMEHFLEVIIGDYLTFIVLLFGLFCVSGNITIKGSLEGTPKLNVLLLLIGAILSSWIGTTGASMIMVRPLIRANKWRARKVQVMVFFIFLVSNAGGCLTPVGDPPLLMGFMRGVDFFWSLKLLPILLVNIVVLLSLFYLIDRNAYKKDLADGLLPESKKNPAKEKRPLRILGLHNIIFLAAIVGAVVLSGVLPTLSAFQDAEGNVLGIHIYKEVTLTYPAIIEIAIILLCAFLSFKTTRRQVRVANQFSWGAIQEVAVLFIGIFITMIPALLILNAKGADLGLTKPWQMFWVTGLLSSFLDNTPTYMVFMTVAGTLGATSGISTTIGIVNQTMLKAISCGAVFMGANTYIGNAPNFMVKSIAEENGIKMPSFFGYMLWSLSCLIPVFLLDMIIFFI